MKEKVVVLGAGIAGMTAGINLLQKGYKVTIIEKNDDIGGLCQGYFVNGHYIDACIHWLMGTNKDSYLYKEWVNIGAFAEDTKIISLPSLGSFEYEGTTITFHRDLDKTQEEWIELSPKDEKAIRKFIASAKDMGSIMGIVLKNKDLKPMEVLKMLPNSAHIIQSMLESRETYSKRFEHPAIRFAIKNAQTGYNNMFFFLDLYGLFFTGNADVPEGGAYHMVQRIKKRFLDLGGELLLNTEAQELLIENKAVFAVKTDKETIEADHFISSLDPKYTLKKLLGDKYKIRLYEKLEEEIDKRPISSCFNVYLAVEGDVQSIDVPTVFKIAPIKVGSKEVDSLLVRPYHFDPDHFVKDGKTVVCLFADQDQNDYAYYKSLGDEELETIKGKISDAMIQSFLARYPQYKDKVEVLSCFGPIEIEKRSNTCYGSIQSYSFTDKGMFFAFDGKMKELDNLYFCGQWVRSAGGTPTALITGREVAKQFKELKD